jgi:transcription antitermination factor NusG
VTPYVYSIVGRGRVPEPVPDDELSAMRAMIAAEVPLERFPYLAAGKKVRIERGPLAGIEGVLVESRNSRRVVVSIALIHRSVAAEVDVADISLAPEAA